MNDLYCASTHTIPPFRRHDMHYGRHQVFEATCCQRFQRRNLRKRPVHFFLTFICPCIARISLKYNQQDAKFSRSIYFYKFLYRFQAVPPPIIRSAKLYIQRQVLSNQYCCLLLSWVSWNSSVLVWQYLTLYAVLCSWWWAEEPPETRRAIYRNKQIEKKLHLVGCTLETALQLSCQNTRPEIHANRTPLKISFWWEHVSMFVISSFRRCAHDTPRSSSVD